MTLSSMTGFARATGQDARLSWAFELKCVNGRALEVRCRLPPGLDALEPVLRSAASAALHRGNLNVALQTVPLSTVAPMRINRAALDAVLGLIRDLGPIEGLAPARLDGVLALRGVIEAVEPEDDEATRERRMAALKASFDQALSALVSARRTEGAALAAVLNRTLDSIVALCRQAEDLAALRPDAVRERLRTQVKALLEAGAPLPEERLAQELALIAVKLDVREELDRLKLHEASARQLIGEGGAVGRRLDFLAQEFNREANTLCAKSNDPALTAIGLELKALIDQFREQVQNVE
ncbi:MAG: YicC family protein [Alphaproteobacteria bacterium]|nr:YicC family protein [Alphaproteobacteria bacterium]